MGSLALHKIMKLTKVNLKFAEFPKVDILDDPFNYMLELYMDYCIVLDIPRSQSQPHHVVNIMMTGICYVLPLDKDYNKDAISLKKILKRKARGQSLRMC